MLGFWDVQMALEMCANVISGSGLDRCRSRLRFSPSVVAVASLVKSVTVSRREMVFPFTSIGMLRKSLSGVNCSCNGISS